MEQLAMITVDRIEAQRVLLRKAQDTDREGLIELRTDPRVGAHIGGALPRERVERYLDELGGAAHATAAPGSFIVADRFTDDLLGTFELKRRPSDWPGHVTETGEELELGYLMLPEVWGAGLAREAAAALLRAAAQELPDQPVLISTESANERSLALAVRLGFRPVQTFEWFDNTQTLCLASLHSFAA
ncbi:GNAT family N-acetyltransferase [Nocardia sp. NPDC003693]